MSVLSEVNAASIAAAAKETTEDANIPPEVVAAVRTTINALFWKWYKGHETDTVAHVHFWLFSKELKVSDLHQAFTLLFGAEGEDQTVERPPATVPATP